LTLTFNAWVETDGCGAMPLNLLTSMESLSIVVQNTIPDVAYQPVGRLFMLVINGSTFTPDDGSFTVSGQSIDWTSSIYSVQPSDTVVAIYSYMG
jgi:predicted NAD/FAD-dependent oxidoreductase